MTHHKTFEKLIILIQMRSDTVTCATINKPKKSQHINWYGQMVFHNTESISTIRYDIRPSLGCFPDWTNKSTLMVSGKTKMYQLLVEVEGGRG